MSPSLESRWKIPKAHCQLPEWSQGNPLWYIYEARGLKSYLSLAGGRLSVTWEDRAPHAQKNPPSLVNLPSQGSKPGICMPSSLLSLLSSRGNHASKTIQSIHETHMYMCKNGQPCLGRIYEDICLDICLYVREIPEHELYH